MLKLESYTGGIVGTNAHLLSLSGGTLLVDAPEGVQDWIADQGVRVDALLLTHQHFDHVMDAARVQAAHGCPVYAWSAFDRNLTLEKFFGAMAGSSFAVPPFEVTTVLADRGEITVAGCPWRLFHVPGHSPDSVCFWNEEQALLFSGDVIFSGSIGRTDFPGGSHGQLITGIREKLLPLPPETRVFPGHGPDTTLGQEAAENPFL